MINKKGLDSLLYPKRNSVQEIKNSFEIYYKKMFLIEVLKLFLPVPGNGFNYGQLLEEKISKNYDKNETSEIGASMEANKWALYDAVYFFIKCLR